MLNCCYDHGFCLCAHAMHVASAFAVRIIISNMSTNMTSLSLQGFSDKGKH